MDEKFSAAAVGAFVLLLGAALVGAVLWLAAGVGSREATHPYQAVIQESVAGLSLAAPVKYLGVDVGKVDRIEIDPGNPKQVRLHFLIRHGTPIQHDSVAVLKTQGLTGIAYVEISGGSAGSPPLLPGADGEPPTIPFKPSLSARLENVLAALLGQVDHLSDKLDAVLDADNQAALKSTLADLALVARSLAAQRAAIESGLADAARTAALAARAGQQLGPVLDRVASSAQAVERLADVARLASARAGDTATAATRSVQQLDSQTLPDLARLMADLNSLAVSLRQLSEQTTAQPSSLLAGPAAPVPGPGEIAP